MLSAKFDRALLYASDLHRHQVRKTTGSPYIGHLLAVAGIVIEYGGDEDEAIAALLHDAIEDQGGELTGKDILNKFGSKVFEIVEGCTDSYEQPKRPWKERKDKHIAHVRTATTPTLIVVAADKLYNARMLYDDYLYDREDIWIRFRGGKEGSLWYYDQMVSALREGYSKQPIIPFGLIRIVDELERVMVRMHKLVDERAAAS